MSLAVFESGSKFIWYNNQMVKWNEAATSVLAHGLHYSSSAFEGVRFYNGRPFKLRQHLERLLKSANILKIELPYSIKEIEKAIYETLDINDLTKTNGYIRPVIWRGAESMMISGNGCSTNVAIAAWQFFEHQMKEKLKKGLHFNVSKWVRPNSNMWPSDAKLSATYAILTMVKNQAHEDGFDDSLMLDSKGNITEATTSNFFAIKNNELFTPKLSCFLNGITRQTVLEIAKAKQINCHEVEMPENLLNNYDATFITGTACEIAPISKITLSNGQIAEFDKNHSLINEIILEYAKITSTN